MRAVLRYGLGLLLLLSCTGDGQAPAPPTGGVNDPCRGLEQSVICAGTVAHTCSGDGISTDSRDCVEEDLICQPGRGCVLCTPGEVRCEGNRPRFCNANGDGFREADACDASVGEYCSALGCAPLCAQAAEQDSYIGCEYWPTTVFNPAIRSDFEYAVVVANPQLVPAEITIQLGAQTVRQVQVGPGSLDTIRLPWNFDLKDGGEVDLTVPIDEEIPPPMSLVERAGASVSVPMCRSRSISSIHSNIESKKTAILNTRTKAVTGNASRTQMTHPCCCPRIHFATVTSSRLGQRKRLI